MYRLSITLVCLGMLMGCNQDAAKPKATIDVLPMDSVQMTESNVIETMMYEAKREEFFVQHHVRGNNVYVECYIPNFTFNNQSNSQNKGYLNLYVDHKKVDKITTAAFIVKGLSEGKHDIRLEIVHNSNQANLNKQFQVFIR